MNIPDAPQSRDRIGATQEQPLRKLGIAGVEDVPWGTHICQVYTTQADLLEILTPYFSEGLKSNEFCLWITAEPLGVAGRRRRCAAPCRVWTLCSPAGKSKFSITAMVHLPRQVRRDRAHAVWLNKLETALARGFDGLRLTGDTYWLAADEFEPFIEYEAKLDPVIACNRMLAICSYSAEKFGMREIFDAISNHDFALIREHGRWEVLTSYARRRAARSLRESEARLRATVEGVAEGIFTLDETGTILFANSAALRMFGYTACEVIGKNISTLAPATRRINWDRVAAKVMRIWKKKFSGRPHEAEGLHKDGSLFPIEYATSEIPLDGQRLTVGFVRDLTDRAKPRKECERCTRTA